MKYRTNDSRSNYTLFDLDDYNNYDAPVDSDMAQSFLFEFQDTESFKPWPICERYLVGDKGTILRVSFKNTRILSGHIQNGRKCVCLSVGGIKIDIQISKMVCRTFHGSRDETIYDVHHKNGNRLDNRSANLEWITSRLHRKTHAYGSQIKKITNLHFKKW